MKYQDYYKALDLKRGASAEDIKRAYRTLARKYHPDVNKDPDAQDRFKSITEAYEVLKDPEKRKLYDELGENWRSGQDFRPPPGWSVNVGGRGANNNEDAFSGFSDFFAQIFGSAGGFGGPGAQSASARTARSRAHAASPFSGRAQQQRAQPRRGKDIESSLNITLQEAHQGTRKSISLTLPDGSTKTIDIRIPPATTDNAVIRLKGQGSPAPQQGEPGDIRLRISITPDPRFTLEGRDLTHRITIPVHDAVLGTKVQVPTIEGSLTLTIPPGTQPGAKLRLRGQGLGPTSENQTTPPGDLYVIVDINIPKSITPQQRTLYEQLAQTANNQQPTA